MAKKKAFTWITDKEQEDILAWYEKQRDSTTGKIKEFVEMVREQDLFGRIQKAQEKVSENQGKFLEYMENAYRLSQKHDEAKSKWGGLARDVARLVTKRIGEEKLD